MKRLLVLLTVLMALVLFPSFFGRAEEGVPDDRGQIIKNGLNYSVVFGYFAQESNWWTGLAVTNNDSYSHNYSIYVYDSDGYYVAGGDFSLIALFGQRVDLLSGFITWGSVPTTGTIVIASNRPFIAVKFTGNSAAGGFSEVPLKSELITP